MSLQAGQRRWVSQLSSESGNLESGLVLIPLMILFLSVAQIGVSAYARTTIGEVNQGVVAYSAMGAPRSSPLVPDFISAPSLIALPLPGGGSILVGQNETHNPTITPLLPGGDSFGSTGIAVQE